MFDDLEDLLSDDIKPVANKSKSTYPITKLPVKKTNNEDDFDFDNPQI